MVVDKWDIFHNINKQKVLLKGGYHYKNQRIMTFTIENADLTASEIVTGDLWKLKMESSNIFLYAQIQEFYEKIRRKYIENVKMTEVKQ